MSFVVLIGFVISVIGVVFFAKFIEVVLLRWFNQASARLATFAFLLGSGFGLKTSPPEVILGTLLGYIAVWLIFFRSEAAHG